ncbi:MAG: hypothetical protein FWD22_05725 [Treponema sp.]|nr:hypothetical protein [Treponema sp.]
MRKLIFMPFVCITGALLNIVFHTLTTGENLLPLYLDTIFTITVTLLCGPVWGSITGALTNIIGHTVNFWGWEGYLFTLCNIATALITWLFMRLFPNELIFSNQNTMVKSRQMDKVMNHIFVLMLLSFALCFAMSVLGGLIATLIQFITSSPADELYLKALLGSTMFHRLPVFAAEILSRIPINIIDRLISVFLGYGIAFALNKFVKFLLPKKQL